MCIRDRHAAVDGSHAVTPHAGAGGGDERAAGVTGGGGRVGGGHARPVGARRVHAVRACAVRPGDGGAGARREGRGTGGGEGAEPVRLDAVLGLWR
eukprot:91484-Prymnesium_polylepis.1